MAPAKEEIIMGRKRTKAIGMADRIGEEIDLTKCPECNDHPGCFSCMDGRCTALNESGGKGCGFYCPKKKAIREAKAAYKKLKENGRYDLIRKYVKYYTAMGFLDDEIREYDRKAEELDTFKNVDFDSLMKQTPGFSD